MKRVDMKRWVRSEGGGDNYEGGVSKGGGGVGGVGDLKGGGGI